MKKLIGILLIVVLFSCEKNENEGINIEGFLYTDDMGVPIGKKGDISDDWNFFDDWNKNERQLFDIELNKPCDSIKGSNLTIVAYPNPCKNMIILDIPNSNFKYLNVRMVDANLDLVFKADSLSKDFCIFELYDDLKMYDSSFPEQDITYLEDGKYRIYYQLIYEDCGYMGHGDIVVGEIVW